ncbi:hypothetical protein BDV96DRAFT_599804 [Lophiotrema nucula]|uniref:MI domain-containing protein n=1 Tax=Lophiotrema nucula TaxID=690887 RepID=A0A6A5ZAP5_9PLEO|nr:hypothetical protein BDV96DRAFT_599804 [Lophiotrema nucula]
MHQRQFTGPKLPKEIRDRVDPGNTNKKSKYGRNAPLNRKDRRKAEREEKKKTTTQKKHRRPQNGTRYAQPESESESEDVFSEAESPPPRSVPTKMEHQTPLKSILKKASARPELNEPTPPPSPVVSRALKDRLALDDAEIAALEKKLGIRAKKGKGIEDYGLDDLFGDLGDISSDEDGFSLKVSKRKRPDDDKWLASKRRRALSQDDQAISEDDDLELDGTDDFRSDVDGNLEEGAADYSEDVDVDSDFDGFESEGDEDTQPDQPRVRENPYVAPVTPNSAPAPVQKYIPPSLRAPPSSDAEALTRLRRQIQGLLNRLSDANLLTILKDVEHIYQNNPRGYVTTTVIELLIGLLADETILPDTFLILHAGFIAAIYKIIGPDFGAQMVEQIVSEIDKHHSNNKNGIGKHSTNLISLVAQLYLFQVIGANLVFDYVKLFLNELSELNTELLLRVVKISGSQLRQDDPTSLKDIVLLLQNSVAKIGESNLPVRTKFMIETINNLKNNRMKTGLGASAIISEHTTRMKKQLGNLNSRNLKGAEPIRIGLADIRDTDKKGKWWLVGASWRNNMAETPADQAENNKDSMPSKKTKDRSSQEVDDGEVDLLQLAKEQRMNTDVRRAIFITIMSAVDAKDAHVRLLKLNLKKSQEAEIPRVIVHCAGCEKTYNPYYTLLARKFCSDHKTRKAFQFALWDVFKSLGEKRDEEDTSADEDEDDENDNDATSLRRLVNIGKLYGTLIANDGLPITSLKPLNFPYTQPKTRTFIEIMLVTTILQSQQGTKEGRNEKRLLDVFIKVDTAPSMIAGLQYFMKKVVAKTDIAANKVERETVRWASKVVVAMLTRLLASTTVGEEE